MNRLISLLRRTSVVRRLLYLFLSQAIVIALFCASTVRSSLSGISDNLYLSGLQLLNAACTQMDTAVAELNVLTKFPVLQDAFGNTFTFDYLTRLSTGDSSQIYTDYRNIQAELMNLMLLHPSVSLLGISEPSGRIIYCKAGSNAYQLSKLDTNNELYTRVIEERGGCRLFSAGEAAGLAPDIEYPEHCVFAARAVMKLNHLETVGLLLCCVDLTSMRQSFELGRPYDAQRLSVLAPDGQLIFGQLDPSVDLQAEELPQDELVARYIRDAGGFAVYQFYRTQSGTVAVLRTPVACILGELRGQVIGLGLLLLFFVASVLVFTRLLVRSIRDPIGKLMDVCERIRREEFSPVDDEDARDEMHSLIESFNAMSAHIRRLIEEVYQKNLLQAQTEMQLLRSQINPHFVYNTLETIRAAALMQGSAELADMAALLGKTLRYGVTQQAEPVTIEQELSNLRDYIALQQMHFHGRLTVAVNVEPQLHACYIIKLLLQPLVENAIYHGMSMTEGEGLIRVLGYAEGDDVVFTVVDDGIGIAPDELARLQDYVDGRNDAFTSIGLRNTNRRIRLYYGGGYGLTIRSILNEGTVITVRVPRRMTPYSGTLKEGKP